MNTNEKLQFMNAVIKMVVDYLEDEKAINDAALKPYEDVSPVMDTDPEIKKMREIEAMQLRAKNRELSRHIAVIKRMVPPVPPVSKPDKAKK